MGPFQQGHKKGCRRAEGGSGLESRGDEKQDCYGEKGAGERYLTYKRPRATGLVSRKRKDIGKSRPSAVEKKPMNDKDGWVKGNKGRKDRRSYGEVRQDCTTRQRGSTAKGEKKIAGTQIHNFYSRDKKDNSGREFREEGEEQIITEKGGGVEGYTR